MVVAIVMLTGFTLVAAPSEAVGWDYSLTYTIGAGGTVTYSVTGIFTAHPECTEWEASEISSSTTLSSTEKYTYRVDLTSGIIQEERQKDNAILVRQLSCTGILTPVLNGNSPTYLYYEQGDCTQTGSVLANRLATSPETAYVTASSGHLGWNTCLGVKAGSPNAPVPFTGHVVAKYWVAGGVTFGRMCSPTILGGFAIGDSACSGFASSSSQYGPYYWEASVASLTYLGEDLLSMSPDRLGVGSWGAYWLTG